MLYFFKLSAKGINFDDTYVTDSNTREAVDKVMYQHKNLISLSYNLMHSMSSQLAKLQICVLTRTSLILTET